MFEHQAVGFRNQQVAERKGSQLARIVPEKRLRAAITRQHAGAAVQNQNTIGRGVQNCPEFADLLFALLGRLGLLAACTEWRLEHQTKRALASPRYTEQASIDGFLLAFARRDRQRLGCAGVLCGGSVLWVDEKAVWGTRVRQVVPN